MNKRVKKVLTVVLPLAALTAILGACASWSGCNNDACYDRAVSSVDPYAAGDVAAWGSEKEEAAREKAESPGMRKAQ